MALTVSMTNHAEIDAPIVTIAGDVGHDDLVVDIAATLSEIAENGHLVVDLTNAAHVTSRHLDQLLSHTHDRILIVHPNGNEPTTRSARVAATIREAGRLHQQHDIHKEV